MARIRRHQTVQLDTGGWIELKGCEVLWAAPGLINLWFKNYFWPGGLIFARKSDNAMLLRTPSGNLITKTWGRAMGGAIGPGHISWREVTPTDAFLWLQQRSRRNARRLFPDKAEAQHAGMLAGQR